MRVKLFPKKIKMAAFFRFNKENSQYAMHISPVKTLCGLSSKKITKYCEQQTPKISYKNRRVSYICSRVNVF